VRIEDHREPVTRLIEVIHSGDREQLTRLLQGDPIEVLRLLGTSSVLAHASGADLRWLNEVYAEVLAATQPAVEDQLAEAAEDTEDSAIGEAFAGILLAGLSESTLDLRSVFRDVPPVGREISNNLRKHPSVKYGGPVAALLTNFGLTPASILDASVAVARAIRRFYRENAIPSKETVWLVNFKRYTEGYLISRKDLTDSIAWTLETPSETADALLNWLLALAADRPWLFEGFRVKSAFDGLSVRPLGSRRRQELRVLWSGGTQAASAG
jgi:hypothetical protein